MIIQSRHHNSPGYFTNIEINDTSFPMDRWKTKMKLSLQILVCSTYNIL